MNVHLTFMGGTGDKRIPDVGVEDLIRHAYADRARIAGQQCEADYDALRHDERFMRGR